MTNNVLNSIKETARRVLPAGGHVWLYGSQARGDSHEGSDWDLLVLLNKDRINDDDYATIAYPFTELSGTLGVLINPVLYTKKEWQSYHFTPFYHNVQNDKIQLI